MKKLSAALRGKHPVWFSWSAAILFCAAFFWFRSEFLAWERLPLVGVSAALSGLAFAAVPTALFLQTREKKALPVFLGALAFFEGTLWTLLTLINVDGLYNKRAVGIAGAVLIPIFGVLCLLLFLHSTGGWAKGLRRGLAILLCAAVLLGALFSVYPYPREVLPWIDIALHGGEQAYFEPWSADQPFEREYAIELQKDPDRDFVILNLTDIQLDNEEALGETGEQVKRNTDRLVAEVKPDLITLTGDNAWGDRAYLKLIEMLDAYGIPWAPVMGNHDGQGCPNEFWCAYRLLHAKNCLFRCGPADMGYGNYIINITQDGEILHTLYMMDTHSEIEEDNVNGTAGSGYDHLWENQMAWYAWAVDGIADTAGMPVESTVFLHIPLYEYKAAWEAATGGKDWEPGRDDPFLGTYAETSFGVRHENGGWSPQSNGFFGLLKEKGSTKNVVCGHDHVNDSSIEYQGIRLTYALKDGPGCYWEPELNGGTVLKINGAGRATVAHQFMDFYAQ